MEKRLTASKKKTLLRNYLIAQRLTAITAFFFSKILDIWGPQLSKIMSGVAK